MDNLKNLVDLRHIGSIAAHKQIIEQDFRELWTFDFGEAAMAQKVAFSRTRVLRMP